MIETDVVPLGIKDGDINMKTADVLTVDRNDRQAIHRKRGGHRNADFLARRNSAADLNRDRQRSRFFVNREPGLEELLEAVLRRKIDISLAIGDVHAASL